jgi:VanZ family protein
MRVEPKFSFHTAAKVGSAAIMVLLVVGALGPANWTPRTALGWQLDHFLGYFAITLLVCLAWPRPLLVGGVLVAAAFLLEGLQAFSPGRSANLVAALCSAGGVLAAAFIADLFIRAWRWRGTVPALVHRRSTPAGLPAHIGFVSPIGPSERTGVNGHF